MCVLMLILFAFGCHFTAFTTEKGKSVAHFLFLPYFDGPHSMVMCI